MKVIKVITPKTIKAIYELQMYLKTVGCVWASGDDVVRVIEPRAEDESKYVSINIYNRGISRIMKYNVDVDCVDFLIKGNTVSIHFANRNKYKINAYIKYGKIKVTYEPRIIKR